MYAQDLGKPRRPTYFVRAQSPFQVDLRGPHPVNPRRSVERDLLRSLQVDLGPTAVVITVPMRAPHALQSLGDIRRPLRVAERPSPAPHRKPLGASLDPSQSPNPNDLPPAGNPPSEALTTKAFTSSLPYATTIRSMLERDEIQGARKLLSVAVQESGSRGDLETLQRLLAAPRLKRLAGVRDIDRTADFRTLKQSINERGRWVAVVDGQVVGSAPTLKDLLSTLRRLALTRRPLIHRVE